MTPIKDPDKVPTLDEGGRLLKKVTKSHIDAIHFPSGLGEPWGDQPRLCELIKRMIEDTFFAHHNQISGIVEQTCTWTACRGNGTEAWKLVLDFNNPPALDGKQGEEGTEVRPPHYGYEIFLNGQRVAGPGHIDFVENIILGNYRFGTKMGDLMEHGPAVRREEEYGTGRLRYESVMRKYA